MKSRAVWGVAGRICCCRTLSRGRIWLQSFVDNGKVQKKEVFRRESHGPKIALSVRHQHE